MPSRLRRLSYRCRAWGGEKNWFSSATTSFAELLGLNTNTSQQAELSTLGFVYVANRQECRLEFLR